MTPTNRVDGPLLSVIIGEENDFRQIEKSYTPFRGDKISEYFPEHEIAQ